MADRDSETGLIHWAEGTRGYQGTPRFLYMHIKSPDYIRGVGETPPQFWPRPAHLIMYRTVVFACVIEYKRWPDKTIHEQKFASTEIEQAKAWCEVVWRMGR